MTIEDLLPQEIQGSYKLRCNLASFTWFKVGGKCDAIFKPKSLVDLKYFISNLSAEVPILTIGAGSNVLIRDGGVEGVVIRLGNAMGDIEIISDSLIRVPAGMLNYHFVNFCQSRGIGGLEFLSGIPGTIGGGIAMNAGAYGKEFKDILYSALVMDRSGEIIEYTVAQMGFKYRSNALIKNNQKIVISATLNYKDSSSDEIKKAVHYIQRNRKNTQPVKEKTCGSVFKNISLTKELNHLSHLANEAGIISAWKLVDLVKMRGVSIGGAAISEKHANFIINQGNACSSDIEALGQEVYSKVLKITGVKLSWEIVKVGVN
jgi:UDP-N-acetylmuramate dehydrogenase